jgi:hypothetical protein
VTNTFGGRAAWVLSGAALIFIGAFIAGCNARAQRNMRNVAGAKMASGAPSWPCSFNIPAIVSTIPNDSMISDQPTLNCFRGSECAGAGGLGNLQGRYRGVSAGRADAARLELVATSAFMQ